MDSQPPVSNLDFFPAWKESLWKARLLYITFYLSMGILLLSYKEATSVWLLAGAIFFYILMRLLATKKVELSLTGDTIEVREGSGVVRSIPIQDIAEFGVVKSTSLRRWICIRLRDGSPAFRLSPREKGLAKPGYSQFAIELSKKVQTLNSELVSPVSGGGAVKIGLSSGERAKNRLRLFIFGFAFLFALALEINYFLDPYAKGALGAGIFLFVLIFSGWIVWQDGFRRRK